ncbi:TPA: MFS transporter, partial [Klebsiella pneumoniae]
VCGKKIGPDPRNFNQRVSLGRNDLLIRTFLISFVSEQASAKTLGRAFSLFNFFGMSSAVVAPTLTGFISDLTGSKEISFVMSAGLVVTGTIIFALITLRKNKIPSKSITV